MVIMVRPGASSFTRQTPEGRKFTWRVWLLIWLTPVLFAVAALLLAAYTAYIMATWEQTTGEVVNVYAFDEELGPGAATYAPVFRYTFSDGTVTDGAHYLRGPDYNFPLGSTHQILFDPATKTNVRLTGALNWGVEFVIAVIALILVIPASVLHLMARRRERRWAAEARGLV